MLEKAAGGVDGAASLTVITPDGCQSPCSGQQGNISISRMRKRKRVSHGAELCLAAACRTPRVDRISAHVCGPYPASARGHRHCQAAAHVGCVVYVCSEAVFDHVRAVAI